MAKITGNSFITKTAIRRALSNDEKMMTGYYDLDGAKEWRDDPEARLIMEVRTFRDHKGWTVEKRGVRGEEIPRDLTIQELTALLAKKWVGKKYADLPAF